MIEMICTNSMMFLALDRYWSRYTCKYLLIQSAGQTGKYLSRGRNIRLEHNVSVNQTLTVFSFEENIIKVELQ